MSHNKPKTQKPMPIRWDNVARAMVMESMPFEHAMRQEKYSETYLQNRGHMITSDVRFCEAVQGYRADRQRASVLTREAVERGYTELYEASKDKGNELTARTCLDSYCKLNGYNQETGQVHVDKQVQIIMFNASPGPAEAITPATPTNGGVDVIDAQRVAEEEESKPPGGGG